MARQPLPPSEPIDSGVNEQRIAGALISHDDLAARLKTVEANFGDGEPFETERSIRVARACLQSAADELLRAGRELIRLKEHLPHGEFTSALDEIGLHPRMAQRFMGAAFKFTGNEALKKASLSRTHILELATMDDEQLEAFKEFGTVVGFELDEVGRMSRRQLQDELRKERDARKKDREAFDRQIERRDKTLTELHHKLDEATVVSKGWEGSTFRFAAEVTTVGMALIDQVQRLHQIREAAGREDFGPDSAAAHACIGAVTWHLVEEIKLQIDDLVGLTEAAYSHYKDQARPLEQMTDVFGPVEIPGDARRD